MHRSDNSLLTPSAAPATILVVDDSESVQVLSRGALEKLGYKVVALAGGAEAIRWLTEHQPLLVLLDHRLPDMTGKDIVTTLAERGKVFPFITITAHGDEKIAVEMMKLGALDYLAKDEVFAEMLPAVVRQVLGQIETERRLVAAEYAARESEGRFRSIFENAAAGMATISPDGRLLQVNPALCRFLGYEADEWRSLDVEAISHPDDREKTTCHYGELRDRKRSAFEYEKRYIRPDGTTVWGYTSVAGVYDQGGKLLYCVALIQDVSGRKRYEDLVASIEGGIAIKTGDHFFRSLVGYLAEAIRADHVFVGELLLRTPECIRTIAAIVDGQEEEPFEYCLSGTPCENVVSRQLRIYPAKVPELFPKDHLLTELNIEGYAGVPLFGSSGEPLGLLVALFRQSIPDPDLIASLLQIFSIRVSAELERRQSEQVLRKRERQYKTLSQEFQALLDGIPDMLLLLAPDRKVIWANRAAQAKGGVPERTTGMCCHYLCAVAEDGNCDKCDKCPVSASFATGEDREQVIRQPDATLWGVKTFPLKDRDGQVNRVIMLASDITEKRRLRDEAERAGRLAAVGELAAGVAHEINNPTGLILMNMPVLKAAFEDAIPLLDEHSRLRGDFHFGGLKYSRIKEQLPLLIEEILDGAQRIRDIVDDMKDFARGGRHDESYLFELNQAVKRAVRLVHNQIKSSTDHFSCKLADDLAMVRGNPQRIEQVLVNLIINACQALSERNRKLEVSTSFDAGRNLCRVTVRDEGVGIAEKDLPQLTDPFFTTRRECGGTGLGLSVSARIVREHGGSLQFESSSGQGTTVILALPAATKEVAE